MHPHETFLVYTEHGAVPVLAVAGLPNEAERVHEAAARGVRGVNRLARETGLPVHVVRRVLREGA